MIPQLKDRDLTTPARRGFCANDEAPARVNALKPEWLLISWGPWLWNYSADYHDVPWVIALYDQDPQTPLNPENITKAMAHWSYRTSHVWLLLNEPNLPVGNPRPVEDAAREANEQIALITSVDPQAVFILSCGEYHDPLYEDNSYFQRLWTLIDRKRFVVGFHTHYYPYDTPQSLNNYLRKCYNWIAAHYPKRELWLTEVGRVKHTPPVFDDFTMAYVVATCDKWVNRFAWYAERDIPGTVAAQYECLLAPDGSLDVQGQAWMNVYAERLGADTKAKHVESPSA